jgi:hypothetical protein
LFLVWKLDLNLSFSFCFRGFYVFDNLNKFHDIYMHFCVYKSFKNYISFGVECKLPFSSKEKFSKNYKLPISYQLKLWITHLLLVSYFMMFIMFTSMEKVLAIFRNLWIGKSSILWIYCSFANQSNFNLLGMHSDKTTLTKGAMGQPT